MSEFPHVLLGMQVSYNISARENDSVISEKIQFGFSVPVIGPLINSLIQLSILPYLKNIKSDQDERLNGLKKFFQTEPVSVDSN